MEATRAAKNENSAEGWRRGGSPSIIKRRESVEEGGRLKRSTSSLLGKGNKSRVRWKNVSGRFFIHGGVRLTGMK